MMSNNEQNNLFHEMIEKSPCGVILLDNNKIVYINDKIANIFNIQNKESLLNTMFINFVHPSYTEYFTEWLNKLYVSDQCLENIELICLTENNSPINIEMIANCIDYKAKKMTQLLMKNIAEKNSTEKQAQNKTDDKTHKNLTAHLFLNDHIQQAIFSAEKQNQHIAILYLDLDHFNFINETYGHKIGDTLLELVLERLKAAASPAETILSLEGDRFIIIVKDIASLNILDHISQKYLNIFSTPFQINNQDLTTTATIGISAFPENGINSETLLKNAELAHAHAKKHRQNKYQIFTSSMTHHIKQQTELLYDLKHALEKNEFMLLYQPVIDINTGKILKLEALLRWFRSSNEILLPGDFLTLAEETGLIFPIGEWVVQTACNQNIAWQQSGINAIPISINLSMKQFHAGARLIDNVKNILQQTQLAPQYLEFEISENASILNMSTEILQTLKNMSISLSIDNFGSGFFSLTEIKRYQIKNIKIHRSLIAKITKDEDIADIVLAIISMGEKLGINIIAEGVETKEQLIFLKKNNCLNIQGNYICSPLTEEQLYPIFKTAILKIEQP